MTRVVHYQPTQSIMYKATAKLSNADNVIQPGLYSFLYSNGTEPVPAGNGTQPEIPTSCSTSNCTFPLYESLGVFSQCEDVSQLLRFTCTVATGDWIGNLTGTSGPEPYPNGTMCGYFLNATIALPIMMSGYTTVPISSSIGSAPAGHALLFRALPLISVNTRQPTWGGSINFQHIRNPLANVIIAAAKDGLSSVYRNETPVAQECVLSWCVKRIKSSYHWASYREEIVNTFTNTTPGPNPWVAEVYTSPMVNGTDLYYKENVTIRTRSEVPTYGVPNQTHFSVYSIFDDVFPSYLTADTMTSETRYRIKTYNIAPFYCQLKSNPWLPPGNISKHMDRIATKGTNLPRSSDSKEELYGLAYNSETFVRVRWAWLTFPFILLILSLVFLVATMIKTSRADGETGPGVWKTSAMPTLIYSLPKEMQRQFTSSSDQSMASLEEPKSLRIRLHPKDGWRISGQQHGSAVPILRERHVPPGWI